MHYAFCRRFGYSFGDIVGSGHRGKRHEPAGERLPYEHYVGFDSGVFPGKEASGASESCGNLIEYQ